MTTDFVKHSQKVVGNRRIKALVCTLLFWLVLILTMFNPKVFLLLLLLCSVGAMSFMVYGIFYYGLFDKSKNDNGY